MTPDTLYYRDVNVGDARGTFRIFAPTLAELEEKVAKAWDEAAPTIETGYQVVLVGGQ